MSGRSERERLHDGLIGGGGGVAGGVGVEGERRSVASVTAEGWWRGNGIVGRTSKAERGLRGCRHRSRGV